MAPATALRGELRTEQRASGLGAETWEVASEGHPWDTPVPKTPQ